MSPLWKLGTKGNNIYENVRKINFYPGKHYHSFLIMLVYWGKIWSIPQREEKT